MNEIQKTFIIVYAVFAFSGFIYGLIKCKRKKNIEGSHIYNLIGAFVWADAVVFGIFWAAVSLVILYLNDWILFLLTQSIFWTIRSLGKVHYWFNQQFSTINRNDKEKTWLGKIFQDNYTIWFVYQIQWQCFAVIFIILSIYFAKLWLLSF